MTPAAAPEPLHRTVVRGLKALAGAQSALPATRTARSRRAVEYARAGRRTCVVLLSGFGMPIEAWALVLPGSGTWQRPHVQRAWLRCERRAAAAQTRLWSSSPPRGCSAPSASRRRMSSSVTASVGCTRTSSRGASRPRRRVVLLESCTPTTSIDDRRMRVLPTLVARGNKGAPARRAPLHRRDGAEIRKPGRFQTSRSPSSAPARRLRACGDPPEQIRRHGAAS